MLSQVKNIKKCTLLKKNKLKCVSYTCMYSWKLKLERMLIVAIAALEMLIVMNTKNP